MKKQHWLKVRLLAFSGALNHIAWSSPADRVGSVIIKSRDWHLRWRDDNWANSIHWWRTRGWKLHKKLVSRPWVQITVSYSFLGQEWTFRLDWLILSTLSALWPKVQKDPEVYICTLFNDILQQHYSWFIFTSKGHQTSGISMLKTKPQLEVCPFNDIIISKGGHNVKRN